MDRIAIIGGGLVGAMEACYLAKHGYPVDVYERRADLRKANISAGKSINLALSDRGWQALRGIGLEADIRKIALPMKGRMIHHTDQSTSFQPYGTDGQNIWSVSRGGLNQKLLEAADNFENCMLHFNHKCTGLDLEKTKLSFEFQGKEFTQSYDRVIGTDGAFSAVRQRLQKTDRFDFSQSYLLHGYKELSISPDKAGKHQLDPLALHIWPRGGYMLIALPNLDGSFTVTLFLAYEGKPSFESLNSAHRVEVFFKREFPKAFDLMPDLATEFATNPTGSLVTIRTFPWHYADSIVLMGDAAHAIVPFYGQGMNSGFEDCYQLDQLINQYQHNWTKIGPAYTKERKVNGDAIADLALRNFIEMRDLTGDPMFLLQKKIESRFTALHPKKWLPLYSMVTFSHIPYSKAVRAAKVQDEIMAIVMETPDIETKWDSDEVELLMLKLVDDHIG